MSVIITLEIEVDDELADPDHSTGLTVAGYDQLSDAINSVGSINSGPSRN